MELELTNRRVLLIEDNQRDARLIQKVLATEGRGRIDLEWVQRLEEGLPRLTAETYDAVLLDLSLPDSHGITTLTQVRNRAPDLPVIVLTAAEDEDLGMEAVKEGAQDYLFKSSLSGEMLARTIHHSIIRQELRREIDTLLAIDRQLLEALDDAWEGICRLQEDGRFAWANRSYASLLGYDQGDLADRAWIEIIHPEDRANAEEHFQRMRAEGKAEFETRTRRRDGSPAWVQFVIFQSLAGPGFYCFMRDVSDRKAVETSLHRTEARLRQLMDALPMPVALLRLSDGTWADANPAFLRLIGVGRDQFVGASLNELSGHVAASSVLPILARLRRGETVGPIPVQVGAKSGAGRTVRASFSTAPAETEPVAIVVVLEPDADEPAPTAQNR